MQKVAVQVKVAYCRGVSRKETRKWRHKPVKQIRTIVGRGDYAYLQLSSEASLGYARPREHRV